MVVLEEPRIGEEIVDQGPIIAIHGRAEEADEAGNIELHGGEGESSRRLLQHGLVEGFISPNDLDLDLCMFLV